MDKSSVENRGCHSLRVVDEHPQTASARGTFSFTFNGKPVNAMDGDTIGAALWASGCKAFRLSPRSGTPRALFCAMGICQECVVRVNGKVCTSCNTPAAPGMDVRSFTLPQTDGIENGHEF